MKPRRASPPAGSAVRIPALDGLRGLAIGLVLLAHALFGPGRLLEAIGSVGWLGVDLFFVLSGFLITGILLDTKGTPGQFRNFYTRRILRILPLYYGLLLFLLVLSRTPFAVAFSTEHFVQHQAWWWTHTVNWFEADPRRYWHSGDSGLGVVWSLSIEEQFYLIWPLVVAASSREALAKVCGALMVIAVTARATLAAFGAPVTTLYVLTPTHLDPLAIGSLTAIGARAPAGLSRRLPARMAIAVGAVAFVASTLLFRRVEEVPSGAFAIVETAVTVGLAGLLILTLGGQGWWGSAMRSPVMRWLGKYSYALYLLQFPVQLFLQSHGLSRLRVGRPLFAVFAVSMTCVLAFASWHLWEKHWLALKARVALRPVGHLGPILPR